MSERTRTAAHEKFYRAAEVARIAHWLLNDRGFTRAMAAKELACIALRIDPTLHSDIFGDAKTFIRKVSA